MRFVLSATLALFALLAVCIQAAPAPAQTPSLDKKALAKQRIAARQFQFKTSTTSTSTTAPATSTTVQPTGQAVCAVMAGADCSSCPNCPSGYTCKSTTTFRGTTTSTCTRNSVYGMVKRSDGTTQMEVEQEYWL